ncbi:MAG: hypothetical protein PHE84_08600 [bacterium]|nr:hypothetical protein [bacterium]
MKPNQNRARIFRIAGILALLLFSGGIQSARTGDEVKAWQENQKKAVEEYRAQNQKTVSDWDAQRRQIVDNWKAEKEQAVREYREEQDKIVRLWKDEETAILKVWKEKQASDVLAWRKYGANFRTTTDFESGEMIASAAVLVKKGEDLEQAKAKAYRIALLKVNDQVMDLKPTNKESIAEVIQKKDPQLSVQVEKLISKNTVPEPKKEVVEPVPGTDQSLVQVTVKTSMTQEGMKDLIAPVAKAEAAGTPKFTVVENVNQALRDKVKQEGPYSGLLVNAQSIKLTPCLAPELVSEDGKRIYGMGIADDKYVCQTGLVGWTKTLKPARANVRIGENPLRVAARQVKEGNRIVISNDEANLIGLADGGSILAKGRVVIAVE